MSLYVVAGAPISHSLSPAMHNAAFAALGMDEHHYGAVHIGISEVNRVTSLVRSGKIAGANITYPLKTAVVGLVDRTAGDATVSGAVNTLVPTPDGLLGLSTDGEGSVRALGEKGITLKGKSIVVIGAGGAAGAIALAISREGPKEVRIVNRTPQRAENLAKSISPICSSTGGGLEHLSKWSAEADIIIQASSMGMRHIGAPLPLKSIRLNHRPAIMDIVYNPLKTPLLRAAKANSCTTVDGIDLLVWQGALSFKEWHGVLPPIDVMQQAARSQAGERS